MEVPAADQTLSYAYFASAPRRNRPHLPVLLMIGIINRQIVVAPDTPLLARPFPFAALEGA